MERNFVLSVKGCSKSFPGVRALENVSLNASPGEIHCIVGENGAGKTTLIKIISGALAPDTGEVFVAGKKIERFSPASSQTLGVRTIYQELHLVPSLSVAENIFLGHEDATRIGLVKYGEMRRKASEILEYLRVSLDPSLLVEDLSFASRQTVQIAAAIAQEAKVLIMDEPTASFGKSEIESLLEIVRNIAKRGVAVIYISHHLEEVFQIYDQVTVLRDGKVISCHTKGEVTERVLVSEMVGRDVGLFYTREPVSKGKGRLEVVRFSRPPAVKDVSFSMNEGEILGFGGMVGSGRTELVRLLFGADKGQSGRIVLDGRDITPGSPNEAVQNGISLITEDRQKSGLMLSHSVAWNVTIAGYTKAGGVFLNLKDEQTILSRMIQRLNIVTPSANQEVRFLSGGNQQKVVLAKWLFADARIIIFDEPTRGIDIRAKEEIYKLMTGLAGQGKYIIMISSDMPELIAMSDRVIVMNKGKAAAELSGSELTEENILTYSIGGGLSWQTESLQ